MTTLLIDLGNSRLKWGWLSGNRLDATGAIAHGGRLDPSSDPRWAAQAPDRVICAAVAGESVVVSLADWVDARWGVTPEWVNTPAQGLGLVNAYEEPGRMGVDRWLAMAAVRTRTKGPYCVVDAGTAITVDQVAADGRHLGGWIAPGAGLLHTALTGGTGRIPSELSRTAPDWGCSTAGCVAAGIEQTLAGLMVRVVDQTRSLHDVPAGVWVTGGDADRVLQYLGPEATLAPHLVLEGLARWVEQNSDPC